MGLFTKAREARQQRVETRQKAKTERVALRAGANAVAYASGVVPENTFSKITSVVGGLAESIGGLFGGSKVGAVAESVAGVLNKASGSTISNDDSVLVGKKDNNILYIIGGLIVAVVLFMMMRRK